MLPDFCDFQKPIKTLAVCRCLSHPVVALRSGEFRIYDEAATFFFFSNRHSSIPIFIGIVHSFIYLEIMQFRL